MKLISIDTENSGAQRNKGHPFDPRNKCCFIGYTDGITSRICDIEYGGDPYGQHLQQIQMVLADADLVLGFNLKYDLHWLRRYGIDVSVIKRVWDCQLAHFILTHQTNKLPSLDGVCEYYGLEVKPSKVHEYWDKGFDTDQVPRDELVPYLEHDIKQPILLFERQFEEARVAGKLPLIRLQMADLMVLQEMEWNGLKFDFALSKQRTQELEEKLAVIYDSLKSYIQEHCPVEAFSFTSHEHLSVLLYGGKIKHEWKEPIGFYKTGKKTGEQRYKWYSTEYSFPKQVEPLEGTALKKDGYWATDEETFSNLKKQGADSKLIDSLLEIAKLNKLIGTYYQGIPNKFQIYGWENEILHGQINQCVARTGRTASSNPNLQNQEADVKQCFITRYPHESKQALSR